MNQSKLTWSMLKSCGYTSATSVMEPFMITLRRSARVSSMAASTWNTFKPYERTLIFVVKLDQTTETLHSIDGIRLLGTAKLLLMLAELYTLMGEKADIVARLHR